MDATTIRRSTAAAPVETGDRITIFNVHDVAIMFAGLVLLVPFLGRRFSRPR